LVDTPRHWKGYGAMLKQGASSRQKNEAHTRKEGEKRGGRELIIIWLAGGGGGLKGGYNRPGGNSHRWILERKGSKDR